MKRTKIKEGSQRQTMGGQVSNGALYNAIGNYKPSIKKAPFET